VKHRPTRRALAVGFLVVIVGCGGTRVIDESAHPKLQPNDLVEFYYRGAKVQLDSVRLTRDSVSGIPWHEPTLCCKRVSYALADISTPKIRTFPALGAILGLVAAVLLFLGYEIATHLGAPGY
jgi:hypothetical protein